VSCASSSDTPTDLPDSVSDVGQDTNDKDVPTGDADVTDDTVAPGDISPADATDDTDLTGDADVADDADVTGDNETIDDTDDGFTDDQLDKCLTCAPGDQVLPHLAVSGSSNVWLSWFSSTSTGFDMYLQLMDKDGKPKLDANGLLVSDHPSATWVMDYGLASDNEGNAILAFSDMRVANRLTLRAYKIAPEGTFMWGDDGIALSLGSGEDMSPTLVVASDGDAVVAWTENDDRAETSIIRVQRIAPDGTLRWPEGKTLTPDNENLFVRPQVVAAPDGGFIVMWVETPDMMSTDRVIWAQKFAADGSALWDDPVTVSNSMGIAFYHAPLMVADASGGAFVAWFGVGQSELKGFIQHVDSTGALTMGAEGAAFSTSETTNQIISGLVFVPETGGAVVSWKETSLNQDDCGLYLQAFSATGTRLWADEGLALVPRTDTQVLAGALKAHGQSVIVLYGEWIYENILDAQMAVAQVPLVAEPEPVSTVLCNHVTSKDHATGSDLVNNGFWFAWEEVGASEEKDIYGAFWSPTAP